MNFKYYLRGLGVGIFVTAIIMTIAHINDRGMTDAEVKKRAAQLGMVESTVLTEQTTAEDSTMEAETMEEQLPEEQAESQTQEELTTTPEENATSEDNMEPESSTLSTAEPTGSPSAEPTVTPTAEPAKVSITEKPASEDVAMGGKTATETTAEDKPESKAENKAEDSFTIVVNSGESSYAVSKKLEAAGLVTQAASFDTYLCDNGYDKKIRTGTYEVPADADPATIAAILTGTK